MPETCVIALASLERLPLHSSTSYLQIIGPFLLCCDWCVQVSCIYGLGMPSKYLEASIRLVVGQEWTGGWRTLEQHLEQVRYRIIGSRLLWSNFPRLRTVLFGALKCGAKTFAPTAPCCLSIPDLDENPNSSAVASSKAQQRSFFLCAGSPTQNTKSKLPEVLGCRPIHRRSKVTLTSLQNTPTVFLKNVRVIVNCPSPLPLVPHNRVYSTLPNTTKKSSRLYLAEASAPSLTKEVGVSWRSARPRMNSSSVPP